MIISQDTPAKTPLQKDLAQYGLVRAIAAKAAPIREDEANLFGVRRMGSSTELVFGSPKEIQEDGADLSVIAPDIEPFDMLITRDFTKAVKTANPKTLRAFISRLLDEVE